MSDAGTLDYGSGRYKITGGPNDGHAFHAGEGLEVLVRGQWIPAVIEADNDGRWYFLSPIDAAIPSSLIGLPVRLARKWGRL